MTSSPRVTGPEPELQTPAPPPAPRSQEPPPSQPPPQAPEPRQPPAGGWGDFRRLWLATAVSSIGDGIRLTALPLLALSLTRDPLLLSLVMVANWGPLLLSPLAGVLADVFDRRRLMILMDVGRTVVAALLTVSVLTDTVTLAIVCVAAALFGIGEMVFVVAAQSFLPAVVAPENLPAANGRLHVAQLVLRDSIGQPLGGVIFVAVASLPFLIDGISFAVGVLLLATIASAARVMPAPPAEGASRPRWTAMIAEGARYLRADRLLLMLAVMLGVLNFFLAGIGALEVLYVVDWLDLSPGLFGVFLASGALGGIVGATLGPRLSKSFGLFEVALVALALAGFSSLMLGVVDAPLVAALAFAALGLGGAVYQALTVSFRQATTASEILGRINGIYRLVGTGTAPIGAVAAGVLAKVTNVSVPFVVAGVGVLVLAMVTTRPLLRLSAPRLDGSQPAAE